MSKATTLYDFNIAAGASFDLPVDASFYKILTSTGDLAITRDGGSTVKPMRAGRGERDVPFTKLTLRNLSGATNSGTILVGDSNFIDDTIVLSSSINVRPESYLVGIAPIVPVAGANILLAPGSNPGGFIIQLLQGVLVASAAGHANILAKTSAPATLTDGDGLGVAQQFILGGSNAFNINIANILVPAGKGIYLYSAAGSVYGATSAITLVGKAL